MEKRLIDANDAKQALLRWETDPTDEEIEYTIDRLPTVDAVEVIRCKDCKRCFKHITKRHKQTMWICGKHDFDVCVRPDDFCSRGERKKDGKTAD